ncbi:MAG: hypothetical protein Q9162_006462 [Coniocarpon cinnabarinum]
MPIIFLSAAGGSQKSTTVTEALRKKLGMPPSLSSSDAEAVDSSDEEEKKAEEFARLLYDEPEGDFFLKNLEGENHLKRNGAPKQLFVKREVYHDLKERLFRSFSDPSLPWISGKLKDYVKNFEEERTSIEARYVEDFNRATPEDYIIEYMVQPDRTQVDYRK